MYTRKQVIFKGNKVCKMDYNYQHDVMKNIYRYIGKVNKDLEKELHEKGFRVSEGHIYKLFNYTLIFDGVEFNSENIKLNKDSKIKLILSGKEDIIGTILGGLCVDKKLSFDSCEFELIDILDDKYNGRFNKIMLYKTLSPIVTKTKDDEGNPIYLNPYDEHFYKNIAENAQKKYKLLHGKEFKDDLYFDIDEVDNIKSKSIKIKGGYLVGYLFDIWVETTPDMQKVIYYLGLGQNSSTGLGCLSVITRG